MVQRSGARGFTLIEMLVVVALLGILVGVAVGQYQKSIIRAKEAVLKENLWVMRHLINQYFADKGRHPSDLRSLVDDRYLQRIPDDPFTQSADTWIEEPAEFSEGDISTEPGIGYVRSGSNGVALDSSNYSDW